MRSHVSRNAVLPVIVFGLAVLHAASAVGMAMEPPLEPTAPELAAELEEMGRLDQEHRGKLQEVPNGSPEAQELWSKQIERDRANLERLDQIVASHGWPTISMVGHDGALAAFLIVQHAELDAQLRYLPMLQKARDVGEARPQDVAMLEDRVLMRQGKPQRYGTQVVFDQESGQPKVHSIEDEAHVDERRKSVGLGPLRPYLKQLGVDWKPPESD